MEQHGTCTNTNVQPALSLGGMEQHGTCTNTNVQPALTLGGMEQHGTRINSNMQPALTLGGMEQHGTRTTRNVQPALALGGMEPAPAVWHPIPTAACIRLMVFVRGTIWIGTVLPKHAELCLRLSLRDTKSFYDYYTCDLLSCLYGCIIPAHVRYVCARRSL
jgi:hypothetical protein